MFIGGIVMSAIILLAWAGLYIFFCGWFIQNILVAPRYNLYAVKIHQSHHNPDLIELPNLNNLQV
jgi:hypothetical protein